MTNDIKDDLREIDLKLPNELRAVIDSLDYEENSRIVEKALHF